MTSCNFNPYTNILDLPKILNVEVGDYFIIEKPEIKLYKIDYDSIFFPVSQVTGLYDKMIDLISRLKSTEARAQINEKINNELSKLCNLRISLDPTNPTPNTNIIGSEFLYVHPYKGNSVTLYNTFINRWEKFIFTDTIKVPLGNILKDRCYDVYLFKTDKGFGVDLFEWENSTIGRSKFNRTYVNEVPVDPLNKTRRLIGCIKASGNGISEQSFYGAAGGGFHCKQYVWNAQNRIPVTCTSFYKDEPTIINGRTVTSLNVKGLADNRSDMNSWHRLGSDIDNALYPGNGLNNKFSFIVGDYTDLSHFCQARYLLADPLWKASNPEPTFYTPTKTVVPVAPVFNTYIGVSINRDSNLQPKQILKNNYDEYEFLDEEEGENSHGIPSEIRNSFIDSSVGLLPDTYDIYMQEEEDIYSPYYKYTNLPQYARRTQQNYFRPLAAASYPQSFLRKVIEPGAHFIQLFTKTKDYVLYWDFYNQVRPDGSQVEDVVYVKLDLDSRTTINTYISATNSITYINRDFYIAMRGITDKNILYDIERNFNQSVEYYYPKQFNIPAPPQRNFTGYTVQLSM